MSLALASVPLTPADGVVILIVFADTYIGFRRGVSGEVVRLVSMLSAAIIGALLLRPFGSFCYYHARPLMSEPHGLTFAFATTVVVAAAVRLAAQPFLHAWLNNRAPQQRHKAVGAVAGAVHAAIGITVVLIMMNLWAPSDVDRFFGQDSFVGRHVKILVPEVRAQLRSRGSAAHRQQATGRKSGGNRTLVNTLRERKRLPGKE